MRLGRQPRELIDRSQRVLFTLRRARGRRLRRRHVRLRALRRRPAHLLALVQVPPPARAPLLLRPLPELHDDRGRRAERARLRRAHPRRAPSSRRRTSGARSSATRSRHRQGRRAIHARRLLLPDDDPAAVHVAACTRRFCETSPGSGGSTSGGGHSRRYDVEHRRARVLVVGGADQVAQRHSPRPTRGPGVVLVDEGPRPRRPGPGSRCSRRPARSGSGRAASCPSTAERAVPLPHGADHRRDRRARAAARVSRQRSGRRDAAGRAFAG